LITVLITGAHSITGYNTARALRGENIKLWGLSANKNAFECKSKLWDALYYSVAEATAVIQQLINIGDEYRKKYGDEEKIGLLISEDYIVRAVSKNREAIAKYYKFVLPDHHVVELLLDKTIFQKWAEQQNYIVPRSSIVTNHEQLDNVLREYSFPLIIKPSERTDLWDKVNSTFKGIKLNHINDIDTYYSSLFKYSASYIIQEWIPGGDDEIYFCLFYFSKDGKEIAHFTGRKLLQWPLENGSTSVCIGIKNEELYQQSFEIFSAVNYRGLGSVEFKKSKKDNKFYIIEPTVGRNDFQSFIAVASGINISRIAVQDIFPDYEVGNRSIKQAIWINETGLVRGIVKRPALIFNFKIYYYLLSSKISFALFNFKDPGPYYYLLKKYISTLYRKKVIYFSRDLETSDVHSGSIKPQDSNNNLMLKQLSESDFMNMKDSWDTLLERSSADPLFMSWIWQSLWWDQWAKKRNYKMYLLAAYSDKNELLGLAPLYKYISEKHKLFDCRIIQFIGSSWGHGSTVRSEYLDFIVDTNYSGKVREAIFSYIQDDSDWDQFIFSDIDERSDTYKYLYDKQFFKNYLTRIVQNQKTTYIGTAGSISEYISGLGKSTRYKIINRRNQLIENNELILDYASESTIDLYFDCLNRYHYKRWGKPCFHNDSLEFHKKLARIFCAENKLFFSKISLSGEDMSVLYNLKAKDKVYNIQSGFEMNAEKKISLGLLHFGMAIDSAFTDKETNCFDLLAGPGKNTYYKSHFGKQGTRLLTLQITRHKYLKYIYIFYDALPSFVKEKLGYLYSRI